MRGRVEKIAPLVPEAIAAYQAKIGERLREAIGSADDERIRTEIALFATKVDVAEELDRLRAHLGEVERVLARGRRGRQAAGFPRAGAQPRGEHARLEGRERRRLPTARSSSSC